MLRDYLHKLNPANPNADSPWTQVRSYQGTQPYFKLVLLHHLIGEENHGQHNLFVDLIDEQGNLLDGLRLGVRIAWTWEGRNSLIELAPVYQLDKQPPSPAGDLPLFANMNASAWLDSAGYGSDRIDGLRVAGYPQLDTPEATGNFPGHNSYYAVFQRIPAGPLQPPVVTPPVVTPPAPPGSSDAAQLAQFAQRLTAVEHNIQLLFDFLGIKG